MGPSAGLMGMAVLPWGGGLSAGCFRALSPPLEWHRPCGIRVCWETSAPIPTWVPDTVMAGEGPPPTALLRPTLQVVDGGPSPMTRRLVCLAPADAVVSRQDLGFLTRRHVFRQLQGSRVYRPTWQAGR